MNKLFSNTWAALAYGNFIQWLFAFYVSAMNLKTIFSWKERMLALEESNVANIYVINSKFVRILSKRSEGCTKKLSL